MAHLARSSQPAKGTLRDLPGVAVQLRTNGIPLRRDPGREIETLLSQGLKGVCMENEMCQQAGPQQIRRAGQSNPIRYRNYIDGDGNPSSGYVHGVGMTIVFQDGPRGTAVGGELSPANGAFVEDVLLAAYQRLEFFQSSQYACQANADAMLHIERAIEALHERAIERRSRGVLGINAR